MYLPNPLDADPLLPDTTSKQTPLPMWTELHTPGFLLFWTDKIPWLFHDFPSFFSKFPGIYKVISKLFWSTNFRMNKKLTISIILQINKPSFQPIKYFSGFGGNFIAHPIFSRFHIIFPWFLLNFSKFHISRLSRCTLIFPGFPCREGTLDTRVKTLPCPKLRLRAVTTVAIYLYGYNKFLTNHLFLWIPLLERDSLTRLVLDSWFQFDIFCKCTERNLTKSNLKHSVIDAKKLKLLKTHLCNWLVPR